MTDIGNNCKRLVGGTLYGSWSQVDWKQVEKTVDKLQTRIYLAKLQGNVETVRKLQSTLIKSNHNLLFSIRRVTSQNRGKKTAGMDKQVYLNPERRFSLFLEMSKINLLDWTPTPVRRIEIPREGKDPRPLGIPTVKDRVVQLVVKNALEPEWEAIFEHGSYGFRPKRSSHDAMARLWRVLSSKKREWVLDADIKGCFNNIAHAPLIKTIDGFPAQGLIERWLKAGYFKDDVFTPTEMGTPQGGIISPLLANIALHGMESVLGCKWHPNGYIRSECPFVPVRYADDFVVLCGSEKDAERAKEILTEWLKDRGMEFSPEKTSIKNVRRDGFDFVGWNFRVYLNNQVKNGKTWKRAKGKHVALVQPSNKSLKAIQDRIKEVWRANIGQASWKCIKQTNSILKGWALYHRKVNANRVFRKLDHFMYQQAVRFIRRKHTNKSWAWLTNRYFAPGSFSFRKKTGRMGTFNSNWIFKDGNYSLYKVSSTGLQNYASIEFGRSPFHPKDKEYFANRKLSSVVEGGSLRESLLKDQNGLCPVCSCNILLSDWDEPLHVHHLVHRAKGGSDAFSNLMLLHEECHYRAHKEDLTADQLREKLNDLMAR